MEKFYSIYSLSEPNSESIRYIGITCDIKQRYRKHLIDYRASHRANWIKGLLLQNKLPVMDIFEDGLLPKDALRKEREYILLYKSFGANLVNSNNGGLGNLGYKPTLETIEKIKKSRAGYSPSLETRFKVSLSQKGRIKSEQERINISKGQKGKKMSKEFCEKMKIVNHWKNKFGADHIRSKSVDMLSIDNEFIRTFASIKEAERILNIKWISKTISGVCKGKYKTAGGYKWRYHNA